MVWMVKVFKYFWKKEISEIFTLFCSGHNVLSFSHIKNLHNDPELHKCLLIWLLYDNQFVYGPG